MHLHTWNFVGGEEDVRGMMTRLLSRCLAGRTLRLAESGASFGGDGGGKQEWQPLTPLLTVARTPLAPGTAFRKAARGGIYFLFMGCACAPASAATGPWQGDPLPSLSSR